MADFKPLLAPSECTMEFVLKHIVFPVYGSFKIDGIRAHRMDDDLYSRNLKLIPNAYIRAKVREAGPKNLDGEIVTYVNDKMDAFHTVQSRVMSRNGMPDFLMHVFDDFTRPSWEFKDRRKMAADKVAEAGSKYLHMVEHRLLECPEDVENMESEGILLGYEGLMINKPDGWYKYGRSTPREALLMKLKRFTDTEGVIVGFKEEMENTNEQEEDNLGNMRRSSHKDGMIPKGRLGAFEVEWNGVTFDLGSGMNFGHRTEYWDRREELRGHPVKFKYFGVGVNGKPRHPIFLGLRPEGA